MHPSVLINSLFIKYCLNSHFIIKCCAQGLRSVSPRIKILVRILIFNLSLGVEIEKLASSRSTRGSRERLWGYRLTTGFLCKHTSFVADCKNIEDSGCFDVCPMSAVLLIFVKTVENQKPIFLFMLGLITKKPHIRIHD